MAALLREAMKVPISNRLLLCAEFVPRGSCAADIGTDHGYLSIYLLREGICPFVTAADLRVIADMASGYDSKTKNVTLEVSMIASLADVGVIGGPYTVPVILNGEMES